MGFGAGFMHGMNKSAESNRNALGKHSKNPLSTPKTKKAVLLAEKKMSLEEFSRFSENVQQEIKTQRKRQLTILAIVAVVLITFALIVLSSIDL